MTSLRDDGAYVVKLKCLIVDDDLAEKGQTWSLLARRKVSGTTGVIGVKENLIMKGPLCSWYT